MKTYNTSDPSELLELRETEARTAAELLQSAKLALVRRTEEYELALQALESARAAAALDKVKRRAGELLAPGCHPALSRRLVDALTTEVA